MKKIKNVLNAINQKAIGLMVSAKNQLNGFIADEKGDTNFISIIIVLGVIVVVLALFLAFRSALVEWWNGIEWPWAEM